MLTPSSLVMRYILTLTVFADEVRSVGKASQKGQIYKFIMCCCVKPCELVDQLFHLSYHWPDITLVIKLWCGDPHWSLGVLLSSYWPGFKQL